MQVHLFLKKPNDETRIGRFNQCCQSSFEIVANSCNTFYGFKDAVRMNTTVRDALCLCVEQILGLKKHFDVNSLFGQLPSSSDAQWSGCKEQLMCFQLHFSKCLMNGKTKPKIQIQPLLWVVLKKQFAQRYAVGSYCYPLVFSSAPSSRDRILDISMFCSQ